MERTLSDIAQLIGGEVIGNGSVIIRSFAGIEDAQEGDITFLANPKYAGFLSQTRASAIIVDRTVELKSKPGIRVDNPSLAFVKVVEAFSGSQKKHFQGIHPKAVIDPSVKLGKNVSIGACAVIEKGTVIGDNTVIYPNVYIAEACQIGSDTVIYANVSIRERTYIGNRVIIHNGAVIGSDGFGFVTVNGRHQKIPQVGYVVIEDDVEIGANTTVDRARFDRTIIGAGTKIDNLVQIAHNVKIGKNCIIVAQTGISGSTVIGNNVILAGQCGVVGHISIGDNVIVMARSGVSKDIPSGQVVWGAPAQPAEEEKKVRVLYKNLPKLFDTVREIQKQIQKIKK
ncbi:MAG: UDP-3-O-(3-hydroxymyristoyl)glucosamine N-acyltransferase [Candidatus Omnitrophica bacterium]|nr:UDP-3-O-(3-hydroxymyristoyl)glucosamine N-acyltransferase [Candidatus Omnitrophota bacterium]